MLKEWIDGKWVERESLLAALGLVESSFASGRKPEKQLKLYVFDVIFLM